MSNLLRFFARWDLDGSRVCDHHQTEGPKQGQALHLEPMDRETAEAIAHGLNEGTITPEEVSQA